MPIDPARLKLMTVPLREVSVSPPRRNASGCILDLRDERRLITVTHIWNLGQQWAFEENFDQTRREGRGDVRAYVLENVQFGNPRPDKRRLYEHVDFAASLLFEGTPRRLYFDIPNERFLRVEDCIPIVPFFGEPDTEGCFEFMGNSSFSAVHDALFAEIVHEQGLHYLGRRGRFFKFKLNRKHLGHEEFRGCSGAPIVDDQGRTVALLARGTIKDNCIYGMSITDGCRSLGIEVG